MQDQTPSAACLPAQPVGRLPLCCRGGRLSLPVRACPIRVLCGVLRSLPCSFIHV